MPSYLTLCDFSVYRNQILLFEPFFLDVKSGQAYEIRGQNGIGKTSFLEAISGMAPFQGTLSCLRPYLYVSQQLPFDEDETVLDNLSFWASFWRVPDLISQALQIWKLAPLSYLPYKHLSQGQKQRVNLARLSLKKAPLWFLDEPTATLDQESIEIFQRVLKGHLQQGGAALVATHHVLNLTKNLTLRMPNDPFPALF